jgi:hypothetical protein
MSESKSSPLSERLRRILFAGWFKLVVGAILIAILIGFPTAIVWGNSSFYNPLTQVLFDFLLLGVSVWFGAVMSNEQAKKQATEKWIPAAESACKALLTMEALIERRRRKRAKVHQELEPFIREIPTESPVESVLKMRCSECSESLSSLKLQIKNSLSTWDVFIETNCEDQVCEAIQKRLDETKKWLSAALEEDFGEPTPC